MEVGSIEELKVSRQARSRFEGNVIVVFALGQDCLDFSKQDRKVQRNVFERSQLAPKFQAREDFLPRKLRGVLAKPPLARVCLAAVLDSTFSARPLFPRFWQGFSMILSGEEIRTRLGSDVCICPFADEHCNPNSYDLTLHNELLVYEEVVLDLKEPNRFRRLSIPEDGLILSPIQEIGPICGTALISITPIILKLFAHPSSDVSGSVINSMNKFIQLLKSQANKYQNMNNTHSTFLASNYLPDIMTNIYRQIQYPDDFNFDILDDNDDSGIIEVSNFQYK